MDVHVRTRPTCGAFECNYGLGIRPRPVGRGRPRRRTTCAQWAGRETAKGIQAVGGHRAYGAHIVEARSEKDSLPDDRNGPYHARWAFTSLPGAARATPTRVTICEGRPLHDVLSSTNGALQSRKGDRAPASLQRFRARSGSSKPPRCSDLPRPRFFSTGATTEMLGAFPTVAGERAPRTCATCAVLAKFYNELGHHDLVGNNAVFFVRDPLTFPHFASVQKRFPIPPARHPCIVGFLDRQSESALSHHRWGWAACPLRGANELYGSHTLFDQRRAARSSG